LKAYVQANTIWSRTRIKKFLETSGFTVTIKSWNELFFEGDDRGVMHMMVDLRYKYPIGYANGWTLPPDEDPSEAEEEKRREAQTEVDNKLFRETGDSDMPDSVM
jgi:hypothetical protein